jgi:hypothetical protein
MGWLLKALVMKYGKENHQYQENKTYSNIAICIMAVGKTQDA